MVIYNKNEADFCRNVVMLCAGRRGMKQKDEYGRLIKKTHKWASLLVSMLSPIALRHPFLLNRPYAQCRGIGSVLHRSSGRAEAGHCMVQAQHFQLH